MLIRRSGRVLNEARGQRCTFPECAVAGYQSGKETHHFLDATRFFNEARAVNLIGHPGLVQVFEFGQMPTGGAFMVMEYIAGVTLRDRLKDSERLPEMEALQISLQLASALSAAHDKDIVHRDLKPGNVMILPDPTMPTRERVKLLDFGIAKLGSQSAREDQPRTKTGLSIGTPTYMSPEQCRGTKTLDGKADVYSLGVMMYEMLSGRLPFEADADGAMLGMHMYEEPPHLESVAPDISPSVIALVHRMLAKRAEERPSAREVEEVLTEMAAAVIPAAARPSTKLQTVSPRRSPAATDQQPNASTLGRGVGQFAKARSLRLRHFLLRQTERWPWLAENTSQQQRLLGIGLISGLLSLNLLLAVGAGLQRLLAPQPKVAEMAKVRWTLRTVPAGAQVLRKQDQSLLGQTPWTQEQPATTGALEIVLRLPGYKDRVLTLNQGADVQLDETLEALPPPPPVASDAAEGNRKGGRRSGKGAKDSSKKGSHGSRTKLID